MTKIARTPEEKASLICELLEEMTEAIDNGNYQPDYPPEMLQSITYILIRVAESDMWKLCENEQISTYERAMMLNEFKTKYKDLVKIFTNRDVFV